jgi:hypothetical protein
MGSFGKRAEETMMGFFPVMRSTRLIKGPINKGTTEEIMAFFTED